jgi:hypothetical protein
MGSWEEYTQQGQTKGRQKNLDSLPGEEMWRSRGGAAQSKSQVGASNNGAVSRYP